MKRLAIAAIPLGLAILLGSTATAIGATIRVEGPRRHPAVGAKPGERRDARRRPRRWTDPHRCRPLGPGTARARRGEVGASDSGQLQ